MSAIWRDRVGRDTVQQLLILPAGLEWDSCLMPLIFVFASKIADIRITAHVAAIRFRLTNLVTFSNLSTLQTSLMRQGLKAIIYGSAVVGFGYALMVFTTPTEEQLVARLSPDLKAKYYANKEAQNSRFTHQIQEAAAEKKPIWLKDPKDVLSKPIDNTVDASVLDEQKRLKKLSEEGK